MLLDFQALFDAIFYNYVRYPMVVFFLLCVFAYEERSLKRTADRIFDLMSRLLHFVVKLWNNIDFLRFVLIMVACGWWYQQNEFFPLQITYKTFELSNVQWPDLSKLATCPNVAGLLWVCIVINIVQFMWLRSYMCQSYQAPHNKNPDQARQFNSAEAFTRLQLQKEKKLLRP
jgi:hypothetical protein